MKFKPIWILHTVVVIVIAAFFVLQQKELSSTYNLGIAAAEKNDYETALYYMSSIAEYRDAPTKAEDYTLEINYEKGLKLLEEENWDEALKVFDLILSTRDYKNAEEFKYTCLYEQAKRLAKEGDIHSAELIFIRLPVDFKDVADRKQTISDYKKFGGTWVCDENNLDLKTVVYIDDDNTPKISAELSDADGLLLDEPIKLSDSGMEIKNDRFSWAIYGKDSFSFVYGKDSYTVMKQPVVAGTIKYIFKRVVGADYDILNLQYLNSDF